MGAFRTLTYEDIRKVCLDFPGAYEDFPFGPETAVMRVRATVDSASKVFALLWRSPQGLRINLKCDPVLAVQLRDSYSEVIPGYHMNKRHWNSVILDLPWMPQIDGLRAVHLMDMIEDSYDLIVSALPRRDRMLLGWLPS
jgi:predicted DNA-binding protein (MmcQ/YjbR family)